MALHAEGNIRGHLRINAFGFGFGFGLRPLVLRHERVYAKHAQIVTTTAGPSLPEPNLKPKPWFRKEPTLDEHCSLIKDEDDDDERCPVPLTVYGGNPSYLITWKALWLSRYNHTQRAPHDLQPTETQ